MFPKNPGIVNEFTINRNSEVDENILLQKNSVQLYLLGDLTVSTAAASLISSFSSYNEAPIKLNMEID